MLRMIAQHASRAAELRSIFPYTAQLVAILRTILDHRILRSSLLHFPSLWSLRRHVSILLQFP